MKTSILVLGLVMAGFAAQAKTIAAQSLNCGGLVMVDEVDGQNYITVKKVGQSTCATMEVDSQNIQGSLVKQTTQLKLTQELGNQLVVIINNNESVILNVSKSDNSAMDEIAAVQKEQLAIEKAKEKRAKAKRNAKAAKNAAKAGVAVGSAVAGAASSGER